MIITIDGPGGSGKSTVAKLLAERLGFDLLDTGAMYRAVAWACLRDNVDLEDREAVGEVAERVHIEFVDRRVMVDDHDVTTRIREPDVTAVASVVAAIPAVRTRLVELQRNAARGRDIVCEGRDQGTVVFPEADYKFFVTASLDARARRRQIELAGRDTHQRIEETLEQLEERDRRDRTRDVAPLQPAEGAVAIDTSELTVEEALEQMLRVCVPDRIG